MHATSTERFLASHGATRTHTAISRMIVFVIIGGVTAVTAIVGTLASTGAPEFYEVLSRPAWAPPSWLFGVAWTVLYAVMAVAAALVVLREGWAASWEFLALYTLQLSSNAMWSWFFFGARDGAASQAVALVLLVLVSLLTVVAWRARRLAGALFLPYVLWVFFAVLLTHDVVLRNPTLLSLSDGANSGSSVARLPAEMSRGTTE
jgi:translocator protein